MMASAGGRRGQLGGIDGKLWHIHRALLYLSGLLNLSSDVEWNTMLMQELTNHWRWTGVKILIIQKHLVLCRSVKAEHGSRIGRKKTTDEKEY
jgi:hypothetical protein